MKTCTIIFIFSTVLLLSSCLDCESVQDKTKYAEVYLACLDKLHDGLECRIAADQASITTTCKEKRN